MYENEMRLKEEEYLYSLTQKDELYLNTVTEFEEKLSELRMKNSPSILDSTETPRVSSWRLHCNARWVVCYVMKYATTSIIYEKSNIGSFVM